MANKKVAKEVEMKKEAVYELCECGHLKHTHSDTLSPGHGDCRVSGCECEKFTWKRFLTEMK